MRKVSTVLLYIVLCILSYEWHQYTFSMVSGNPRQSIPIFKDVAAAAGLADSVSSYSAAATDVDGDGYADLALSRHNVVSYHRNTGGGTFADPEFPGGQKGRDVHGISFIDINHDGKSDLAVTRGAQRGRGVKANEYYINTGSSLGAWTEVPTVLVDSLGRGRSITPSDINGDGFTDLLIMNFYSPQRPNRIALAIPGTSARYEPLEVNKAFATLLSRWIIAVDLDNDGTNEYVVQQARQQRFSILKMESLGYFKDITEPLGIGDVDHVHAAVPLDYDNDGDMDILLARSPEQRKGAQLVKNQIIFRYNTRRKPRKAGFRIPVDEGQVSLKIRFEVRSAPQHLYLGKKRKRGSEVSIDKINVDSPILKGNPRVNPDVDVGGFLWRNQNGVFIYEFIGKRGELESNSGLLTFSGEHGQISSQFGLPKSQAVLSHILYRNDGGSFTDVTTQSGIAGIGDAVDAIAADFNNDGFMDVYMVSGSEFLINKPNHLYLNNGNGTFTDAAEEAQAEGPDMGSGDGALAFDYDRDGDLDLFIYNGAGAWPTREGPLVLLQNDLDKANQAVFVDLVGTRSNTRAWGTRLTAKVGGQTLYRQKYALNGHLSTSDLPIHLGVGTAAYIDSLTVFWPTGQDTTLYHIPAGAILTVTEKSD